MGIKEKINLRKNTIMQVLSVNDFLKFDEIVVKIFIFSEGLFYFFKLFFRKRRIFKTSVVNLIYSEKY